MKLLSLTLQVDLLQGAKRSQSSQGSNVRFCVKVSTNCHRRKTSSANTRTSRECYTQAAMPSSGQGVPTRCSPFHPVVRGLIGRRRASRTYAAKSRTSPRNHQLSSGATAVHGSANLSPCRRTGLGPPSSPSASCVCNARTLNVTSTGFWRIQG
ncbi:uncharacterized protein K489DRAFT_191051 [Dissoconium aciculare CBS 342.82]|uniref:Uncharacterized protein n=1 Tax=Dissoconium aciculare CBS 342.82 TaxID=1314786 RepID=A0A6J3M5C3_9PEZI|nr:uncharacterized protein K489DRAFT_191051 [Dissoconium aciculare CBS 342.82]KAF1823261.1 hypothetical protein K489DRAFT_191051 [Dissoconium aciculare CBS 342.82]